MVLMKMHQMETAPLELVYMGEEDWQEETPLSKTPDFRTLPCVIQGLRLSASHQS